MGLKFDRVKSAWAIKGADLHDVIPYLGKLSNLPYWLSVGAQPSDPVERILFRAAILPPPPMLAMAHKGGPRNRRPIDPMTGRPLDLEGVTVVDDPHTPQSGDGAPNKEAT